MHPIKFTSDIELPEWIVAEQIVSFRCVPNNLTSVYLANGKYVFVRETPEEVAKRITDAVTPHASPKASLLSRLTRGAFA
jgi:uncharacterized protein YlzI (FlbEa/FlbD family)